MLLNSMGVVFEVAGGVEVDVIVAPVEVGEMRLLEFEESGFSQGSAGYFEIDAAEFDGSF